MRLLHTADWHLGRTLHGASLLEAQATVLDQLIELVSSERPDAVIVAGDIFDRAYPPLAAVELFDDTVTRLAATRVPIVITSGNHDSAVRLGMNARVAEAAGVHIRTRLDRIAEPIEVSSGTERALIYGVPYLDPPSSAGPLEALQPSHAGVLGAAVGQIVADRESRSADFVVVAAHGVVAGGQPVGEHGGGVERSIDVGGVAAVPRELFAGIDYAAMGHLHHPQGLGERVRYSGAPLAFCFDEAGDKKSVALVTLCAGAAPAVELIPTPQPRAMARLRGTLDELLADPAHTAAEQAWVEATLTDRLRPKLAMERLRGRFPHVLKLAHEPVRDARDGAEQAQSYGERVRGRTELEVAERFLAEVREGTEADAEEHALLQAAFEAFGREEALR
ncbi:MAG: exonuclease SbcCD subunit D [Solirubrobacteraceae bacterium]|nr:exonuclease SbcCD subunit D [Solirubrobacteraceae bacterium]